MIARRAAVGLVAAVTVLVLGVGLAAPSAMAQDGDGVQVPTQDIIPEPDSGAPPEEAGDRGGSLQLAILGLVVVAIVGGALYVARQSKRVKDYPSARIASQADTPSMNPER